MKLRASRSSIRLRTVSGALVFGLCLGSVSLLSACSDDEPTGADVGEACATDKDCKEGLVCRDQACLQPQTNNGPDAGNNTSKDGESNDADTEDPIEKVEAEDYYISYLLKDEQLNTEELHVMSTADGSDHQLSDADHSCALGCWLSRDMKYFLWGSASTQGPAGSFDLHAVEVKDFTLQGQGELIAEGVAAITLVGDGVAYRRDDAGTFSAYYLPLDGSSSEVKISEIGSSTGSMNGWFVAPDHDLSMIYAPTLASLTLHIGKGDGSELNPVYTLDASHYQEGTGSFYGSTMPVAVSRDGKVLAFVVEAPNTYGECSTAADCPGPVKRCMPNNHCTAIELTVHMLDMERLDNLDQSCQTSDNCGPIHQCDTLSQDGDAGVCIPGRVVLGLPNTPFQSADGTSAPANGCTLSAGNPDYHYTRFNGPIGFGADGKLYGVAARDCPSENAVGDSDVISIDPTTGQYSVVWGNPNNGGFDANLCWDDLNNVPDVQECAPYITTAHVSPDGNDIALAATNPWIDQARLAESNLDVWRVLRNGEDHDWIGNHSAFQTVRGLSVHPAP